MSTMDQLTFVHSLTSDIPSNSLIYSLGCWVLPKYQTEQIISEYFWVWFTGLNMLLLYSAMCLVLKFGWANGTPCK